MILILYRSIAHYSYRWGFKRIFDDTFDPEAYIYQHPMFQKGRSDLLKHVSGSNSTTNSSSKRKKKEQPQHVAGEGGACTAVPLQNNHSTPSLPNYNPTALTVMQRSLVNNHHLPDFSPSSSFPSPSFHPQLMLLSNHPNNNTNHNNTLVAVNPLLLGQQQQQQQYLEQQQQYLEQQQRFQQQNALLAQLQAARGMHQHHPQPQLNQLSLQELHLLRAQNADRLLQQLRQQQQQQTHPMTPPRPAPSS